MSFLADCYYAVFPESRGLDEFLIGETTTADAEECIEACHNFPACFAATFYKGTGRCVFFPEGYACDIEGCNEYCEDSEHFVRDACTNRLKPTGQYAYP